MKTSAGLVGILRDYTNLQFSELYTFTLSNNSIYRYSSVDVDISWMGSIFKASELMIRRGAIRQAIGLEVDDLNITVVPTTANIGGVDWLAAVRSGALDGAQVKLERLVFKYWSNEGLIGGVTLFTGFVSDIEPMGRSGASLRVKSPIELLSVQWPRMTYESQCVWLLYGSGCGKNKVSMTVSGNVAAGGNTAVFPTNLAQANNYFDLGVIRFTSGNNIDAVRTIRSFSAGNVTVGYRLTNTPAANHTFTIYPGCDKTQATCANRFTNSNNFRGFPYIPAPEAGY